MGQSGELFVELNQPRLERRSAFMLAIDYRCRCVGKKPRILEFLLAAPAVVLRSLSLLAQTGALCGQVDQSFQRNENRHLADDGGGRTRDFFRFGNEGDSMQPGQVQQVGFMAAHARAVLVRCARDPGRQPLTRVN